MGVEGEGAREGVDPAPRDSALGPELLAAVPCNPAGLLAAVPGLVLATEHATEHATEPQRLSFSREQLRTSPDYHERRDAMPPRRATGTLDAQLELRRLAV